MKREIKFRAWHKATKTMLNKWPYEWREGIYRSNGEKHLFADNTFKFSEDKKKCNRTTGKSVFISLDGFLCGLIPIDEETTRSINYSDEYDLMQFTGLLDKNGKEIYEGDIVLICSFNDEKNLYEVIIKDIRHLPEEFYGSNFTWSEIIGNIYENPELIKTE